MYSERFISVGSSVFERVSNLVTQGYPNACITYVNEIIPTADTKKIFEETLSKLTPKENYKVLELFHGTKQKNIDDILREGFKNNRNLCSAYGKGTYFSPDVSISLQYTDGCSKASNFQDELSYVFLCDVIFGKIGVDNYVDRSKNPSIIVSIYEERILIKYLIAFYRFAPGQE